MPLSIRHPSQASASRSAPQSGTRARRHRWLPVLAAALPAFLLAGFAGHASAAAAAKGGVIHVYEVGTASPDDTDVITGAFTDHGIAKPVVAHQLNRLVLSRGTFEVNIAALEKNVAPVSYNPATCSIVLTGKGPTALSHGTGAYAGIRGTITVTITEAGILPRLRSGACNQSPSATPVAVAAMIQGSGTVSFG